MKSIRRGIMVFGLLTLCAAALVGVEAEPAASLTLKAKGSTFRIYAYKKGLASRFAHDHIIGLSKFSGQLALDPADIEKSAVSFSLEAADLEVLDAELSADDKAEVKSNMDKDVLEVSKYKTIAFKSSRVRLLKTRQDPKRGEVTAVRVTGQLTLHGVTKAESLDVELHRDKGRWVAIGGAELAQTRYGIEPYSAFLGAVGVKDKVKIRFQIIAAP